MAESFGGDYTIVEVTAGDGSAAELWIALAKPKQARTLVLAQAPEGASAEVYAGSITDEHRQLFRRLNLKPGDVYEVASK
ncbi:hypothetical protein [Bradyrhizobium arachidis]|uniref:hypothetical protein n=1 Tax=Bradyrhizobium arachidis TaxID=858423 RepID=UPI002163F9B0|nr:hypothetical protein [Bradyrhizobium arachidis]UVO26957.1 hypothetical protein KUF59_31055 [Bradyrhizobium arachidis]